MMPTSVKKHHANVRALGCILTGRPDATLHHVHGGSIKDRGWHVGMGQKQNEALVIPLALEYHSFGPRAIDGGMGVLTWEKTFGTQASFIDEVGEALGYSLWELAEQWQSKQSKR
jgi:hypothetical protein